MRAIKNPKPYTFNVIFKTARMPEEWWWSIMIPLYKNKVIPKTATTIGYHATKTHYESFERGHRAED